MTALTAGELACVDTNIVVYAYDPADLTKHQRAIELLEDLSNTSRLVLSTQVLNEFSTVMLRGRGCAPLSVGQVRTVVEEPSHIATLLPVTPKMSLDALRAVELHRLSFWDELIWAAAREHGVRTIYSEDFQHGREVEGVRFINPFV